MKILYVAFILSLFISAGCNEEPKTKINQNLITDDLHKSFEFLEIPEKVVTLAPNLTELMFELGLGNKIIGNTSYCNFPEPAKSIENVADLLTVNLEKIVALNPDLIFITAEGNSRSDYDKLTRLGLKVFVSKPKNYAGIKKTLLDMSKIFKVSEKADSIVKNWDSRIAKVKQTHDKLVYKTALFLISTKPLFSAGKNSFVHQILTFAGLENLSANSDVNYPMLNREEIVIKNPDYILLYSNNNNDVNELLKIYPEWNTLSAIVNKRVFYIDADLFSRPGPRFVDAVEELNKLVLK